MPLVPAKCPECGGNINVDSTQRLGICEYCKQPFVVEEAVHNFNTTYNITNNNEIKADVVNVYGEENIDLKLKEFVDKISLILKLENQDKTLSEEIQKFYDYAEEHKEKVLVQETFLSILLDSYKFSLKGNSWRFISKTGSPTSFNRKDFPNCLNPLDLLFDKVKIISLLDDKKGELADTKVNSFFDDLYEVITKPISKTNQVSEMQGVYECEYSHGGDPSGHFVDIISLAYGFLICERYPDSYAEIYKTEIRPIIEASKEHYLGYLMIFGRLAKVPGYYMDEGYRCSGDYYTLLDVSITKMSQIDELKEINKDRVSPHQIYNWEEEKRHLSWFLEDKKCYECKNKLSLSGKCRTPGCKYYDKSIKKEMSLLGEKIRIAKMG